MSFYTFHNQCVKMLEMGTYLSNIFQMLEKGMLFES